MRALLIAVLVILMVVTVTVPASAATPPTIYVGFSGDSPLDYTCDGTADDVQIQQAIDYVRDNAGYTTVFIHGAHTYDITASLEINDDFILTGDSDAKLRLTNSAGWSTSVPIIGDRASVTTGNITIHGFEIDGNRANQAEGDGAYYYNGIGFYEVGLDDIEIYDMYMHDNKNDLIYFDYTTTNVAIHDNTFEDQGHEAVYANYITGLDIYNNEVYVRVNSAFRTYNCKDIDIYNNTIYGGQGGYCGIYIIKYGSGICTNVNIYDNEIYNLEYAGILLWGYGSYSDETQAQYVNITNNIIRDNDNTDNSGAHGGIAVSYFDEVVIENNLIYSNDADGIAARLHSGTEPTANVDIYAKNNIIMDNTANGGIAGSGYGIQNYEPTTHDITVTYCDVYDNVGTYTGGSITYTDNVAVDPLFYDEANNKFWLNSTATDGTYNGATWETMTTNSALIDGGDPNSTYSNEPENNGDRINIGAWGNTAYASKTFSASTPDPSISAPSPATPYSSTVNDTATFSISINQTVNVTWYLNSVQMATNTSVTSASWSNSSTPVSSNNNVTAAVTNVNGSDSYTWDWTVQASSTVELFATPIFVSTSGAFVTAVSAFISKVWNNRRRRRW